MSAKNDAFEAYWLARHGGLKPVSINPRDVFKAGFDAGYDNAIQLALRAPDLRSEPVTNLENVEATS